MLACEYIVAKIMVIFLIGLREIFSSSLLVVMTCY